MARNTRRYKKRTINDIPEFDRPREKMMAKGPESLSTLELMAVLVGSGNKSIDVYTTARDLAKLVEKEFDGLSLETLQNINGVGKVKACQIMAAIEFSRRFLLHDGIPIKNDTDILPLVEELRDKKQEYFLTFTLDGGHHLIEKRTVFIGTLNQSLIHPREIFADAITDRAAAVIFVHNHTAAGVYPSKEDILVTKRLLEVAELMGIEVLDHIIVNKTDSFSFKNKGMLDSKF